MWMLLLDYSGEGERLVTSEREREREREREFIVLSGNKSFVYDMCSFVLKSDSSVLFSM